MLKTHKFIALAICIGLLFPSFALAETSISTTPTTKGTMTCSQAKKVAKKTFKVAMRTAKKTFKESVRTAEITYIKAIRLPDADKDAARVAMKAAKEAAKTTRDAAELAAKEARDSLIFINCGDPKSEREQEKEDRKIEKVRDAEIKACIKEAIAAAKQTLEDAKDKYSELARARSSNEVLAAQDAVVEAAKKNLKEVEKNAKKNCELQNEKESTTSK